MTAVYLKNLDLSKIHRRQRRPTAKSASQHPLPFPVQLHQMLNDALSKDYESIVSWNPDGTSFHVHDPQRFLREVLPTTTTFRHTKYKSFLRQLYFYGFTRITENGPYDGSYHHPMFTRTNLDACYEMTRFPRQGKSAFIQKQQKQQKTVAKRTSPRRQLQRNQTTASNKQIMKEEAIPIKETLFQSSATTKTKETLFDKNNNVIDDDSSSDYEITQLLKSIIDIPSLEDISPIRIEQQDDGNNNDDGLNEIDDDTWQELLHLDDEDDNDSSSSSISDISMDV